MRRDKIILLLILIPVAILMFFVTRILSSENSNKEFAETTPFPTISIASSDTSNQYPVTPTASQNIEVLSPFMGDSVQSGFVVKGNARTFENVVNIRLTDSMGNILTEEFTTANAPDIGQFGPFEKQLFFETEDSEGLLEVFQYSAKDASEVDKVEIPLIFK